MPEMDAGFLEVWGPKGLWLTVGLASCGKEFRLEPAEFTVRAFISESVGQREGCSTGRAAPPWWKYFFY